MKTTWHEKIWLKCTKYTPSHYSMYLTSCVRYTSFVNCIRFPIVFYSSCKSFIDKLCLSTKLYNFKIQKSSHILCAHKPYFLMLGHILFFISCRDQCLQLHTPCYFMIHSQNNYFSCINFDIFCSMYLCHIIQFINTQPSSHLCFRCHWIL